MAIYIGAFIKKYDLVLNQLNRIFTLMCFQIFEFAIDFDAKPHLSYGHPTLQIRHT